MFDRITHWIKLYHLNGKERRGLPKNASILDRERRIGTPRAELERLDAELMSDIFEMRDERSRLDTRDLLAKANRLGVPLPSFDNSEWDSNSGLSAEGRSQLRSSLRKEQNERWDLRLKIFGY